MQLHVSNISIVDSATRAYLMGRLPRDAEYHTEYQAWFNKALERKGITLKLLSVKIGADYSHLWRIARGDPSKYPNSTRPGYEMNELIGRELDDLENAMVAARYWKRNPDGSAVPIVDDAEVLPMDSSGNGLSKIPKDILTYVADPDVRELIRFYGGLPPESRTLIKSAAERMKDASDFARELGAGKSFGAKRSDEDENPTE